jgi:hypothetical protein
VLSDLRDEKLTLEYAREVSSVVVSPATLTLDFAATARERTTRRGP